jgi:hypothetical protein
MENEFDAVMAQRTDAELVAILNSNPGDYQPAAMEAAKRVFNSRNLSQEQVATAKQEIEQNQLRDEAKANEPLFIGIKILAFIFPGILVLMFAGTYKADGYDKKAKELTKWTLLGFGFYFGFALLIVLLETVFKV